MRDLGTLGGASSRGLAINASGHVAGGAQRRDGVEHAFVYTNCMFDLGTLGGATGVAAGINAQGWLVGTSETARVGVTTAFVHDGTALRDLNDLLDDSGKDWVLLRARDNNDAGQIVADAAHIGVLRVDPETGVTRNVVHAVLLTPLAG